MRYLLFLLLLTISLPAYACSCSWTGTFCEYADSYFEWSEGKTAVVRARFLEFRTPDVNGFAPLYDFEVIEVMAGELSEQRVTLWGHDGGNCNGPVIQLIERKEYIVMFPTTEGYVSYYPEIAAGLENPYPIYDYPGCGPATLAVNGRSITGEIKPGVNRISTSRLRGALQECLGDVVNPGLFPITSYEAFVFPNPAQNQFTLRFSEPAPLYRVSVYDMLGRLILVDQLNGTATTDHEINVDKLPAGVYQVVGETDGLRVKKQVVVF